MTEKHACPKKMDSGRGLGYGHVCGKNAAHEHDGVYFCKLHHPPTVLAKNAARNAALVADIDRRITEGRARDAARRAMVADAGRYEFLVSCTNEQALDLLAEAVGDR